MVAPLPLERRLIDRLIRIELLSTGVNELDLTIRSGPIFSAFALKKRPPPSHPVVHLVGAFIEGRRMPEVGWAIIPRLAERWRYALEPRAFCERDSPVSLVVAWSSHAVHHRW